MIKFEPKGGGIWAIEEIAPNGHLRTVISIELERPGMRPSLVDMQRSLKRDEVSALMDLLYEKS